MFGPGRTFPSQLQVLTTTVAIPPGWVGAKQAAGDVELELYVPRLAYTVGERATALAVLRNRSRAPLDYQAPCNNYVNLVIRDSGGQILFDWTLFTYGEAPPCPRGERRFAPGEAVQIPLEFVVPVAGSQRLRLYPYDPAQPPRVELPITATKP